MLTSESLIKNLDEIIERAYLDFTYRIIGDEFFTDAQKTQLLALGLIPQQKPLIEVLYQMVRQRGTEGYQQDATFKRMLEVIAESNVLPDLSEEAEYTLFHAKSEIYSAIENTKQKVKTKIKADIMEANQQTKEELSTEAPIMPAARLEVKNRNMNKLLAGLTIGAIAGSAMGIFRRDFTSSITDMINSAVVDDTRQAASRQGINPGDALVYKQIVDDSRTSVECRKFHTVDGSGANPKVYRLSELIANGSNDGKPRSAWKPVVGPTHPNCYSDQAEVLTKNGWKFFKDVDIEKDLFMSVDLKSGNADWVKAVAKVDQEYKGPMLRMEHKTLLLDTTPNHNHVLRLQTKKNKKMSYKYEIQQEIPEHNSWGLLRTIPNWNVKSPEIIMIENVAYRTNDFCQFMGWWLSEGCITKTRTNTARIDIHQQKEQNLHTIESMLKRMFRKPGCYSGGKFQTYVKADRGLGKFLMQFGKSYEKYIPEEIKNLKKEHLEIFIKAYVAGDGHIKIQNSFGYTSKEISIATSSKKMADDLGEIILKLGKRPSYAIQKGKETQHHNGLYKSRDVFVIRVCNLTHSIARNIQKTVYNYEGRIYDVELDKWHTLIIRQNGKVVVSGNCRCTLRHVDDSMLQKIKNKK